MRSRPRCEIVRVLGRGGRLLRNRAFAGAENDTIATSTRSNRSALDDSKPGVSKG